MDEVDAALKLSFNFVKLLCLVSFSQFVAITRCLKRRSVSLSLIQLCKAALSYVVQSVCCCHTILKETRDQTEVRHMSLGPASPDIPMAAVVDPMQCFPGLRGVLPPAMASLEMDDINEDVAAEQETLIEPSTESEGQPSNVADTSSSINAPNF